MSFARNLKGIMVLGAAALAVGAMALDETWDFHDLNLAIPDNNAGGITNQQVINGSQITNITDLNVCLNIERITGGWNGDLVAILKKDGKQTYLLNRVGKRSGSTVGYSDDGLNIMLDDEAPIVGNGTSDVHIYRIALFNSHTTGLPSGTQLTGTWQPDARNADPTTVLDTSVRNAWLDQMDGLDVNGTWELFVADRASGDTHKLKSWCLQVQGTPEPASMFALISGVGSLIAVRRRRQ